MGTSVATSPVHTLYSEPTVSMTESWSGAWWSVTEKEKSAGLAHQSASCSSVPSPFACIPLQQGQEGGDQPLACLLTLPEFILRLYNLSLRLLRIN